MDENLEPRARIAKQFGFALKDQNPNIRFLAIEGMQFLHDFPECREIAKLLNDPDRFVKWKAIQVCGTLKIHDALPVLIKYLHSMDLYTRSFSTTSVAQIGDPSSLSDLLMLAKRESSARVKQSILRHVGNFSPQIPWDFMSSCARDANVGVRLEAAKMLGFLRKNDQACPILLNLLEQESDSHVFATAILSLGKFRKEELMGYFHHSLLHQEPRIRANAIEALGEFPFEKVEKLIKPYLTDPSNRVKGNVISIYFKYGLGEKVHGQLQKLLTSENRWERSSGAWLAGTHRITSAFDALIKLLGDEEAVVAERSAWALGQIQAPRSFEGLHKAYFKANQWALVNIIKAMGATAKASNEAEIVKLMHRENSPPLKALFINLLTTTEAKNAKADVMHYLQESEHRVRGSVYQYLGTLHASSSADVLFQGLSDPHPHVRGGCAHLLLQMGDFRALKILSEMLNEQDKLARVQATQTLRDIAQNAQITPPNQAGSRR